MSVRGRVPGQRQDPESLLDNALAETMQEMAASGTGVDAESVVRASAPRERRARPERDERQPRRRQSESRAASVERDEQGRFLPRSERRSAEPSQDDVDPYEVLEADSEEEAPTSPRRPRRTSRRDYQPVDDDEDDDEVDDLDDEDDDEDEDDESPARRRRAPVEEAEDDELAPEDEDGQEDDEDDEDEDERPVSRRPSRQKRFSKKIERVIQQQVEKRVGSALQERDALRQQQEQRERADQENAKFLADALGTPEQRAKLEARALDPRVPQRERDIAAAHLRTYRRNAEFFEKYRNGAWAVIRYEQAQEDAGVMKAFKQLKALDPKIVAEGNRGKTLVHAYVTGRDLGREEAAAEIKRLKRQIATLRGTRSEKRYRDGITGRPPTVASASGRRANGRTQPPDMLRGSMRNERGIGSTGTVPMPTDEVLRQLREGEITLADLRLGKVAI